MGGGVRLLLCRNELWLLEINTASTHWGKHVGPVLNMMARKGATG